MWRFHSWVAIRNPALMIWHACQNAKMSGFLIYKNLSVWNEHRKRTPYPGINTMNEEEYMTNILENGSKIVPKKGILIGDPMHWTNPSEIPWVWHPESHTPRPLPRGGQLQLGDQCLCKKRERMAISHDLIAGDTLGGGLVGFEGVGLLGCKKVGIGNLGNFGTFFIYRVHRSI